MTITQAAHQDPYFMTNAEVEEMDAVMHEVPDEDWAVYFEATHVDPAEVSA